MAFCASLRNFKWAKTLFKALNKACILALTGIWAARSRIAVRTIRSESRVLSMGAANIEASACGEEDSV